MVSVVSPRLAFAALLVLSSSWHYAEAHTWIDCFDTDRFKLYDQSASYIFGGAGGNGFCAGYGAGYPSRGDGDIGTEYTHKLLKNEVEAGAPVCQDVGSNTYSDWRKRLSVAPGQTAYFAYLPNGHIVKDKKGVGTQHGVYWTGQVGTSLSSTHDMTPEHLVDGRTMDYDDGNCGETVDSNGNPSGRAGDGKPCIGSFVIPQGTAPGIYNMVWYWKFWLDNQGAYKDQDMAKGYFGAAYSTCFEVEVTSGSGDNTTQQAVPAATQPLVAAEAAPMPGTPAPVGTPATTPAPTVPIVQAETPTEPPALATPVPSDTPAATPAATTPAPVETPVITPAITTPTPTMTPTIVTLAPAGIPEATPALTAPTPVEAPAAPVATPAPTTGSPEIVNPSSGSTGSICRRRMRS